MSVQSKQATPEVSGPMKDARAFDDPASPKYRGIAGKVAFHEVPLKLYPQVESQTIAHLERGLEVTLVDTADNGTMVEVATDTGLKGWLKSTHVNWCQSGPRRLPELPSLAREPVTPSDLTFLSLMEWTEVMVDGVTVVQAEAPDYWAVTASVKAALLANEAAGNTELRVERQSYFFGLLTRTVVWSSRLTDRHRWDRGSLESLLSREGRVSDIIYAWIGTKSYSPESQIAAQVLARMIRLRLIQSVIRERRHLRIFRLKTTYYVKPAQTAQLMSAEALSAARGPSISCQRNRPAVYATLVQEIVDGFNRRTLSSG